MPPPRSCAILFRLSDATGKRLKVLAANVDVAAHFRSLDPWASQLRLEGRAGTLLLRDNGTNQVLCRREVTPDMPGTTGGAALKAPVSG